MILRRRHLGEVFACMLARVVSAMSAAVLLFAAVAATAGTSSDRPAAIVVYPYVKVDTAAGVDTQIQLTNTTQELVGVQCFYERIEVVCVGGEEGQSCEPSTTTCTGTCTTELERTEFSFRITAQQPLGWSASNGLSLFPLDGSGPIGPGGQTNGAGTIPALGPDPVTATLRCVAVDAKSMTPVANNALVGQATVRSLQGVGMPSPAADAAQYRAIGIAANPLALNDSLSLHLGGPQAEYEACSSFHLLEHFFAHAPLTTGDRTAVVDTTLVLASCGSAPGEARSAVAQFLVHNEFAQRFSTSRSVNGHLVIPLAMVDTTQETRSIFSVEVQGTLAGRTQIGSLGGGVHALAIETHRGRSDNAVHSAGFEVNASGERLAGDVLVLDSGLCVGDCDLDGDVVIAEVVTGIGIGIGQMPLARCEPIDVNDDERVGIEEMVSSVASSIEGCPTMEPTPNPSPTLTPTPTIEPATDVTPEITHLGLATADDRALAPDEFDDEGRPVFIRPFGQGFTLLVEARRGTTGRPIAGSTFSEIGGVPDLQILASNALGDGNPEVCEQFGTRGGIPAVPDLEFALADPFVVAAINDLGCRAYDRMTTPSSRCTRSLSDKEPLDAFAFVVRQSTIQFCVPIARAWALPVGETIFAARVRDQVGSLSEVREVVVRVEEPVAGDQ